MTGSKSLQTGDGETPTTIQAGSERAESASKEAQNQQVMDLGKDDDTSHLSDARQAKHSPYPSDRDRKRR